MSRSVKAVHTVFSVRMGSGPVQTGLYCRLIRQVAVATIGSNDVGVVCRVTPCHCYTCRDTCPSSFTVCNITVATAWEPRHQPVM